MKFTSVEGRRFRLDAGSMFSLIPKTLWRDWVTDVDDENRLELASRSLLVRTDQDKLVLCDVDTGDYLEPKLEERYGLQDEPGTLFANLAKLGVAEEDIDYIVLSHLHFDHVGSLLPAWSENEAPDADLRFPNARYIVSETQFEAAANPHRRERSSFIKGLTDKLKNSGRLILLNDKKTQVDELAPAVTFEMTAGHTRGMLHTFFHTDDMTLFVGADIFPCALWINPVVTTGFDRFPELTVDEKTVYLKRALDENWLVFFCHDPSVSACRVALNDRGRYEAIDCDQNIIQ